MESRAMKIEVLPSARLFDEREWGLSHTPYEIETAFYSCIGRGDMAGMKAMLKRLVESGIVTGKLSISDIRQTKYWAVCCIAIATRYAIAGGVDEVTAYNFSDECIMKIDLMEKENDILNFLLAKSEQITALVSENKLSVYPRAVRKCISIINKELFGELNLSYLSQKCEMSKDHLASIFKKSTGLSITQYVRKERLSAAKELLNEGLSISQVAYTVGFSTESYFIKCFKDEYGTTPKKYKEHFAEVLK